MLLELIISNSLKKSLFSIIDLTIAIALEEKKQRVEKQY